MGGATELEIAAQLGHSNTQTTRRYVHIAQDHLRQKAEIMGTVITKAVEDYGTDHLPLIGERKADGQVVTELEYAEDPSASET